MKCVPFFIFRSRSQTKSWNALEQIKVLTAHTRHKKTSSGCSVIIEYMSIVCMYIIHVQLISRIHSQDRIFSIQFPITE